MNPNVVTRSMSQQRTTSNGSGNQDDGFHLNQLANSLGTGIGNSFSTPANTQEQNNLQQQDTQTHIHTHTHTHGHTHTIPQASGPTHTIPGTNCTDHTCTGMHTTTPDEEQERNRKSQYDNMTEHEFINQITNRVTLQLSSQLTEKFTPIFTTLHTNQSHLSRSIEQMVRRFDGQIGDITRRQALQDNTPHPNFSPAVFPNLTEVIPSIPPMIPEYTQDYSSEIHQTASQETYRKHKGCFRST
eukprot:GHVR01125755.1.p1 GENE.GHVR01125755.1~~GHVR01125755.1.p1  ORF type:complete len:243 (-),score=7.29 GHVR01125755.1:470-1198(-)